MSDIDTSTTVRRIRTGAAAHFAKPAVLMTLLGVSFVLGVSGPFDTLNTLGPVARLAYWSLIVFVSYAMGTVFSFAVFGNEPAPSWLAMALSAPVLGLLVMGLLIGLNTAFFGPWLDSAMTFLGYWGFASVVSFLVTALSVLSRAGNEESAHSGPLPPTLLRRLPVETRGELVSLSVTDHYVQIVTVKGREMVLMRLRDAMDETAPGTGLQVHRSHWVATDHVAAIRRRGDGAVITTSAEDEIPVSRGFMKSVRAAGLLPDKLGKA